MSLVSLVPLVQRDQRALRDRRAFQALLVRRATLAMWVRKASKAFKAWPGLRVRKVIAVM